MKQVEIKWVDSSGTGGDTWQDLDYVRRVSAEEAGTSCWSTGYLVFKDDRNITLALSHNGDHGMVMDPVIIPRCSILEIHELVRVETPPLEVVA